MKNYAVINGKKIGLSPLDVIRTVASHLGFDDVDVDPGPGFIKVSASRGTEDPITAKGATYDELCDNFVGRVLT